MISESRCLYRFSDFKNKPREPGPPWECGEKVVLVVLLETIGADHIHHGMMGNGQNSTELRERQVQEDNTGRVEDPGAQEG